MKIELYTMSKVMESVKGIVEECSALANPYRFLAMVYLTKNKTATWSTIKQYLEENVGIINPNTLHFHLKILIDNGYIKRSGGDKTYYEVGENSQLNNIVKKYATKANLY